MTLSLQDQQSAEIQIPDDDAPWRADRLGDRLVITTSAIAMDAEDAIESMRGCLLANVCSDLSVDARFTLNDEALPCLETTVKPEEWQSGIDRLVQLKSECASTAASMDFSGAQQIEQDLDQTSLSEDADAKVLELLRVLDMKASSDAELAALLSIDEVQGAGTLEPDDESWVIAVGPSFRDEHLSLTLALAHLGDGDADRSLLQQGLQLGSARVIGPDFRLGCDPTAETLLLCTDLAPHSCDVGSIKEAIGGLLLLAQRLEPRLFETAANTSTEDKRLLQPTPADSLSAYSVMRA